VKHDNIHAGGRNPADRRTKLPGRPRAPVAFEDFIDEQNRAAWIRDEAMTVFSLHSRKHPATEIDLFVEAPFDFNAAYGAAIRHPVGPYVEATFVSYDDLVAMKRDAGRAVDLDDVAQLEKIRKASSHV
jgi:hypothetical protein